MTEKRRLLNFVCSNSIWKDGQLHPNHRKPFGMIASANLAHQEEMAASLSENGHFDFWLPGLVPQSVLVWDGVRIEMERATQNHKKIRSLPQTIELHGGQLQTSGEEC